MPRAPKLIASGVAQADTGQTTVFDVPENARSLMLNLSVSVASGTTPLTDFKLRYVHPKITGAPTIATTSAGGAAQNEVQTLTLTGGLATETFKLTYNGNESDAVTLPTGGYANTTAAQVKAALITIADWTTNTADIAVVKASNDYAITFSGALAATDISAITVTSTTGAAAGSVAETTKGRGNEIQTITLTGGPTNGTWAISWGGVSSDIAAVTAQLPAAATATQVQDALNKAIKYTAYGPANAVTVTRSGSGTSGAPYVYRLTFVGDAALTNVDAVTVNGSKLYTYAANTAYDFAGWDGITQIAGTTSGDVIVIVGPDESDTTDDTGAIYQVQAALPPKLAAVVTFDRTSSNELYTWSLYQTALP